jgi:hypothetical protein
MLMLAISLGLASIFTYSAWSPDWLSTRWTPARLIRESRGILAVRWFFAAAAIGALALALVQWKRAGESPRSMNQIKAKMTAEHSKNESFANA